MGLNEKMLTDNLILTVVLAFAEYKRGMIVGRTQTGKAVARQDPTFRTADQRSLRRSEFSFPVPTGAGQDLPPNYRYDMDQ